MREDEMDPSSPQQMGYRPLDLEALARASDMMELTPDKLSVRIIGLNGTYPIDDLIPGTIGLEQSLGENGVFICVLGYIFVAVIGALGNGLVLFTVLTRPKMRIMRHVFICNLAASDFVLCAITTPLTLLEVLGNPIGTVGLMCKIVPALQATSVYVSTLNITAIALERYKVIVYSIASTPSRKIIIALLVGGIWLLAVALSMPFIIFRTRVAFGIPKIRVMYKCTEVWPMPFGRALYSIFCMVFQYCMPSFIIGAAHARIVLKLRRRFVNRFEGSQSLGNGNGHTSSSHAGAPSGGPHHHHPEDSEAMEILRGRRKKQQRRQTKTNLLLCMIALIFALCWLPLNVVNIIADFSTDSYAEYRTFFDIVFVGAHLFAMSSAVANPILYGFLNENFRHEFREVFLFWMRCLFCGRTFGLEQQRPGSVVVVHSKVPPAGTAVSAAGVAAAPSEVVLTSTRYHKTLESELTAAL
ncbi:putative Neuropeptide F receptor [Hypsibius exemplaris]|uniref:Neuropeptide F receptor n=1 Tax=Hypsibius exemplaris TaxID=2072580 RepID=A0A1W0WNH6_HYPEX|nr:putative Neuropeptide F receptor [Hypsibius exemplaris]